MALRPYQRALIGLAAAAGYTPTPQAWRDQLLKINGEFRRSARDLGFRVAFETMLIAVGTYGVIVNLRSYIPGDGNSLFAGGMCVAIVATGILLVSRNRIWYRFADGTVSALKGRSKLLWQEDLAGLESVVYTYGQLNSFIKLLWPHRKRRIELYSSLRRELSPSATRHISNS
jgi:hypothetical protein